MMNGYDPYNRGTHTTQSENTPYRATGWEFYNGAWHPVQPGAQPAKAPASGRGKRIFGGIAFLLACAVAGFGGSYAANQLAGEGQTVVYKSAQTGTPANGTAGAEDKSVSDIAAIAGESVVSIITENVVADYFTGERIVPSAGSGVIISQDGTIITNHHVVGDAKSVTAILPDGSKHEATVIGSDAASDIAVIEINVTGLTPAVAANSNDIRVGDFCLAVGNPMGTLGGTVTEGIISALDRDISIQGNTMNLLQMSAPVSPGNSGGGLFNSRGELIAVVNAKAGGNEAESLGFAIPVNDAMAVAESLIENGYVAGRPALGVTVVAVPNEQQALQAGVDEPGVYIATVNPGGAANKAGVLPGDRIVAVDGQEIAKTSDLSRAIRTKAVGDSISLTLARDGSTVELSVTLEEMVPVA